MLTNHPTLLAFLQISKKVATMDLSKKQILSKGKRLLINAALKLTADTRNLNGLSLRELAREAGLNPNTFYRHFKNIDELGLAILAEIAGRIRQPLRDLRRQAAESITGKLLNDTDWERDPELSFRKSMEVTKATVGLFFDYAADNADAIILGVREQHGASPILRKTIREMMQGFANDMAEDIQQLNLLPPIPNRVLQEVSESISREMFQLSMDYIERPNQRQDIIRKAEKFITTVMIGTTTLHGYGPLMGQALQAFQQEWASTDQEPELSSL